MPSRSSNKPGSRWNDTDKSTGQNPALKLEETSRSPLSPERFSEWLQKRLDSAQSAADHASENIHEIVVTNTAQFMGGAICGLLTVYAVGVLVARLLRVF